MTVSDLEDVGKRFDEVNQKTGINFIGDPNSLYKHAITKRISGTMLSVSNGAGDKKIVTISSVFGHNLKFY